MLQSHIATAVFKLFRG